MMDSRPVAIAREGALMWRNFKGGRFVGWTPREKKHHVGEYTILTGEGMACLRGNMVEGVVEVSDQDHNLWFARVADLQIVRHRDVFMSDTAQWRWRGGPCWELKSRTILNCEGFYARLGDEVRGIQLIQFEAGGLRHRRVSVAPETPVRDLFDLSVERCREVSALRMKSHFCEGLLDEFQDPGPWADDFRAGYRRFIQMEGKEW